MQDGKGQSVSTVRLIVSITLGILLAKTLAGNLGGIIFPLVIAYICARLARPPAIFISRACKINPKVGGAVFALILCGAGIYIITTASSRLVNQLWSMLDELPAYAEHVTELAEGTIQKLSRLGKGQHGTAGTEAMNMLRSALDKGVEYVGNGTAKFLGSAVQSVPKKTISVFVSAVGFIYLTADMDGAQKSICSLLPQKYADKIKSAVKDVGGAMFSYLRAIGTLAATMFLILSVGLSIIGVKNPLASALIIAFVDALPMLGCGIALIPWALWSFLTGKIAVGVGLLILLVVVYVVRQFLEPRVIGKMTGVHPFVALACVFIGLKLGGIGGMILAPICLMCAVQIKRDRDVPEPEEK